MAKFIPVKPESMAVDVPFYEDSLKMDIPGRGVTKEIKYYQNRVAVMIAKLGGVGTVFISGEFPGSRKRDGYRIEFSAAGQPHRIECAALPLHWKSPKKKDRALAQALYILGNKLESMVHNYIYEPDSLPLVPYMIGAGGKTVTEAIQESQELIELQASGALASGNIPGSNRRPVVEGKFEDA